jgi:hypothetical protein
MICPRSSLHSRWLGIMIPGSEHDAATAERINTHGEVI